MTARSTTWEDTNYCANQYMCDLDIYLNTMLSYSYGIITDRTINAPGMEIMLLTELTQQTNVI